MKTKNRKRVVAALQAKGAVGLTKAQMAAVLQVSVRTINGMIARGEIAYWRIGKRLVRFHIEDAVRRMNEMLRVPADDEETWTDEK
jgi:excisionase family DNA binding protein